jgi:cellulose synthase/poly-beta-1,6-N-acetylglucosamine synthase-like glycosyltransferase
MPFHDFNFLSAWLLILLAGPLVYLYTLALGSLGRRPARSPRPETTRFAIAIPAHNEAGVIRHTISTLKRLNYPMQLLDVHVVADNCSDDTARIAREAGALVHVRNELPQGSKGAALAWLFDRILGSTPRYDTVVVFDADTQVDPEFLRAVSARLEEGAQVIQGCHRISNPLDGVYPALTSAMFIVDNRFQNQGRANLDWSAKNMGDSICLRTEVLERLGWGGGLTEDYEFRLKALLAGVKIAYEPRAIGYGEAPSTWAAARIQRSRWLSGTHNARRRYAGLLVKESVRRRDLALVDGALQALLPSYSTLTIASGLMLAAHVLLPFDFQTELILLWAAVFVALLAYPVIGLALEHAPLAAFLAVFVGPLFVFWRTWLAFGARFGKPATWVRTGRRSDGFTRELSK